MLRDTPSDLAAADVAVGISDGGEHLRLGLRNGVGLRAKRRQRVELFRQILKSNQVVVIRQRQQHLQRTQQLPHIAGPRIAGQRGQRVRRQPDAALIGAQLMPKAENEAIDMRPLPQR